MRRGSSRILAAGALLLGTMSPVAAANYRWIDDDGVVHLTNNQSHFEAQRPRALPPVPEPPAKSTGSRERSEVSRLKESAELRRTESVTTEVMRLSGLSLQVDLLAMVILGEFDRLRTSGSPPAAGAVPLVAQTFSAETLRSNMREALARSLDPERTRALLAWLRAPLSLRIVSLESALPTAGQQAALTDYVNLLPTRSPAPARLALIQRLERAGDVTQGSAAVRAAASTALQKTLRPFVPPSDLVGPVRNSQQTGPSIDETTRFRTMVSLLFTYRDLSDAELGRYVTFLESPIGRWFTRTTQAAFLVSLDPFDQPERAGASIAAGKRPRPSEAAVTVGSKN